MSNPEPGAEHADTCNDVCETCIPETFGPEFSCIRCTTNTGDIGEYYMVHDFVWKEAGNHEGMLCVECLEFLLGRELTPLDFPNLPINSLDIAPKSPLLMHRLGIL